MLFNRVIQPTPNIIPLISHTGPHEQNPSFPYYPTTPYFPCTLCVHWPFTPLPSLLLEPPSAWAPWEPLLPCSCCWCMWYRWVRMTMLACWVATRPSSSSLAHASASFLLAFCVHSHMDLVEGRV